MNKYTPADNNAPAPVPTPDLSEQAAREINNIPMAIACTEKRLIAETAAIIRRVVESPLREEIDRLNGELLVAQTRHVQFMCDGGPVVMAKDHDTFRADNAKLREALQAISVAFWKTSGELRGIARAALNKEKSP